MIKRLLFYLARVEHFLAIALIAFLCFLYAITLTTVGLRWLVPHVLPPEISIKNRDIEGYLFHPVLKNITYKKNNVLIQVKRADLQWHLNWQHGWSATISKLTLQPITTNINNVSTPLQSITLEGHIALKNPHALQARVLITQDAQHVSHITLSGTPQTLNIDTQLNMALLQGTATGNATVTLGAQDFWQGALQLNHVNAINAAITSSRTADAFTMVGHAESTNQKATFHIDTQDDHDSSITFEAPKTKLTATAIGLQHIDIHYQDHHNQAELQLSGTLHQGLWSGKINTLHINTREDSWNTDAAIPLELNLHTATLSPLTLHSGNQSITLQGHKDSTTWSAQGSLQNFKLANLQKFLPPLLHVDGTMNANFSAAPTGLSINAHLNPVTLFDAENKVGIHFDTGDFSLNTTLQKLKAQLSLTPTHESPLLATVLIQKNNLDSDFFSPEQTIDAHFNWKTNILDMIPLFVPEVEKATGTFTSTFSVNGTIGHPNPQGRISVTNGILEWPDLGLNLKNITFSATPTLSHDLQLNLSLNSGTGTLNLDGAFKLNQPDFPGHFTVAGQNITILNNEAFQVIGSPNLTINTLGKRLVVTGQIIIPSATIAPKSFTGIVSLPNNFVFVGKDSEASTPLHLDVIINNVLLDLHKTIFKYQGIDAIIEGKATVHVAPEQQATANGTLNVVSGTYTAYGQSLDIRHGGKLLFSGGPLVNPGLNIQATKKVLYQPSDSNSSLLNTDSTNASNSVNNMLTKNIEVGMDVTGFIADPVFKLFSNPSGILSDSDILSYLTLGVPQSELSQSGQQAIIGLLNSISPGGNGASGLKDKLQNSLALDELSVGSVQELDPQTGAPVQNTALVLGKNITKKLSVSYNVGLSEAINVLKLRYKLSKKFSIESDNSTFENGADLFFHFFRD